MAKHGDRNPVLMLVPIPIGEEWEEPTGWVTKDIHSVDVDKGLFYALLMRRSKEDIKAAEEAEAELLFKQEEARKKAMQANGMKLKDPVPLKG